MKTSLPAWLLRGLFVVVVGSMLFVTSRASLQCPLFDLPPDVLGHPWFIATLLDAYWGFITFYVWAAWKERSGVARGLWLPAVLLLGNFAMAAYFLRELSAIRTTEEIGLVFTRRNPGHVLLPGILLAIAAVVLLLA